jgi:hypothetical protein
MNGRAKGRAFEREVALLFGGKRTPLSGAAGGNDITFEPDGIWADWGMEAKRRARLPVLVTAALDQAEAALPLGTRKRPAVVMREDSGRMVFVAYASDVKTWCEALAEIGESHRLRPLARELRAIAAQLEAMR